MKDIHNQTFYELLEIEPTATQEEILRAYNRARATYGHNSPALYSLFNKEEAQELLKLIDEAYAVLSNQFKRRQYDSQTESAKVPKETKGPSREDSHFAIPSASALPPVSERPANRSAPPETVAPAAPEKAPPAADGGNPSTKLTPFGNYKVDPLFEDEIKRTEVFSGTILQKVRIYKNVNIDQISELTKISRPYLIAIESNNFSSLPAPVFVRGFIVQIAKILGLDPAKVANSFIKLLKESQSK